MIQSDTKLPLSPCQLLILADLQSHPESAQAYNLADYVEIEGKIDVDLLEIAIQRVIARTASLRIQLLSGQGQPTQIIRPELRAPVFKLDLRMEQDPHAKAIAWMEAQRQTCFDPFGGQLLQLAIMRIGETKTYLHCQSHHLIADGVGLQIFRTGVAETYTNLLRDKNYDPPDDQSRFESYLRYNNQYLSSPQHEADVEYWSNLSPTPTTLTVRRHFLRRHSEAVQSPFLRLHPALSERLAALAQSLDLRLPQLFISAFIFYASSVLKRRSLTIELPTHGRVEQWMSSLVAACANVLPVTISLDGNTNPHAALRHINDQIRVALSHRRLNRIDIRGCHRANLGDLRHCSLAINALPYTTHLSYGDARGTQRVFWAPYVDDLTAYFFMGAAGNQTIRLDANAVNFQPWEVDTHLERFHEVLSALAEDRDTQIARRSTVPLVTEIEPSALEVPTHLSGCFHRRFEQLADESASAVAAMDAERSVSYAAIEQRANQIAHALIGRGIKPGQLVGLATKKNIEAGIAVLGVMKAGAICVPYDQLVTSSGSREMWQSLELGCAIVDDAHREQAHTLATNLIALGHDEVGLPTTRPSARTNASEICFAVLGVRESKLEAISHRKIAEAAAHAAQRLGFTSADRIALQFSSPTRFWFSGLLATWWNGGTALIQNESADVHEQLLELTELHATAAILSTAHWSTWVQSLRRLELPFADCLKTIVVGGQPMPPMAYSEWLQVNRTEKIALFNAYGAAQLGGIAAAKKIEPVDADNGFPVGIPLEHLALSIIDDQAEPAPRGSAGEVCARSDGLLIRTKDRGRIRHDGQLEFLGRSDLRTIQDRTVVEIADAEDAIRQHPAVLNAAVISQFQNLRNCLVCYYIPLSPHLSPDILCAYLLERVPHYLVPTYVIATADLPLDSNGDINRHLLAERRLPTESVVDYAAPRNQVEATLISIWSEALQVERLGIHDNLFDLGADSISSTFALACMQDQFGLETDMGLLFECNTVALLAEKLAENARS